MKFFGALLWIDQKIIELLEKHCRKTQQTIGWTNFTFARVAVVLIMPGMFMRALGLFAQLAQLPASMFAPQYILPATVLSVIIMGPLCMRTIYLSEKIAAASVQRRLANPLQNDPEGIIIRLLAWILFVDMVEVGTEVAYVSMLGAAGFLMTGVCVLLFCYLLVCTPFPPCDSKLKQWLQSLFLKLVPIRIDK